MGDQYPDEKNTLLPTWQQRIFILGFRLFLILQCNRKSKQRLDRHETIVAERFAEPHPVKRTVKKYKISLVSSRALLAAFYAARQSVCFSIGVRMPRLRWTRLVL